MLVVVVALMCVSYFGFEGDASLHVASAIALLGLGTAEATCSEASPSKPKYDTHIRATTTTSTTIVSPTALCERPAGGGSRKGSRSLP